MLRHSIILALLLTCFHIAVAAPDINASPAGLSGMEELRSNRMKQEELARYAKGAFLAGLSLGPDVAPPTWTSRMRHACFVTFFSGKRVVACAGGFTPRTPDLGREIGANVRQALLIDPRAGGIDRKTALGVRVLITFPSNLRPVESHQRIDPSREGLFVENDLFGVAIVPGEAKTSSWAFREALRRLGEKDPAKARLFAFDAWGITSEKHNE